MSSYQPRKSSLDETFEYIESHDARRHVLDVIADLAHLNPDTVRSNLVKLADAGKIARPARGYYQRKAAAKVEQTAGAPTPAAMPPEWEGTLWANKGAPMGARICAYLKAAGDTRRRDLETALADPRTKAAIDELVRAGTIRFTGGAGAVLTLGTREPAGAAPEAARRWNGERPASWKSNPAAQDQLPPPSNSGRTKVLDLVLQDFKDRAAKGLEKYGRPLFTCNGRDALLDAYQEALDLCMYLRQAIEEQREAARPAFVNPGVVSA